MERLRRAIYFRWHNHRDKCHFYISLGWLWWQTDNNTDFGGNPNYDISFKEEGKKEQALSQMAQEERELGHMKWYNGYIYYLYHQNEMLGHMQRVQTVDNLGRTILIWENLQN